MMTGNPDHIELLRRGPRPWNEWRLEAPSTIPNLIGISLSVGGRQLGPISGGPIDLAHALLREAVLQYATLTGANLEGADLSQTDLRDARLEGASLFGTDLRGAVLDRANLDGANLTGANLRGASLVGVRNLTPAQLHEAEGDATTVLPEGIEAPLIWTVAQSVDTPGSARERVRREIPVPQSAFTRDTVVEVQSAELRPAMREPEPLTEAEVSSEPEQQPEMQPEAAPAPQASQEVPAPRQPQMARTPKPPEAPAKPGERTSWLVGGPKAEARPRPDRSYGKPDTF